MHARDRIAHAFRLVMVRHASSHELDVLGGLKDGLGQFEISQHLGISESTVKQRALKACTKLGAKSRTQAVAIAVARNYFES